MEALDWLFDKAVAWRRRARRAGRAPTTTPDVTFDGKFDVGPGHHDIAFKGKKELHVHSDGDVNIPPPTRRHW